MLPAIYMLFSYWMSGVNNNFGIFISSTLCTLLSVLAGESIGLLLGAAVLDVEKGKCVSNLLPCTIISAKFTHAYSHVIKICLHLKGMVVMTVISLGLMVVGGFFVRQIPFWITWLGYISPFKYSYNASVQLVFDKPVPCDGSGVLSACGGASSGAASVQDVLKFLGVEFSTGFNVAMLLILFVGMRFFAFFALKHKKSVERSN